MRFLFKNRSGQLWCFNKPALDSHYFGEVPNEYGTGVAPNQVSDSQDQRFAEEDDENDVDLAKSMWLIIRKKRSKNEILRYFCPERQSQALRVRDLVKFGRVNFKITTLKSKRIDPEYCGSCYVEMPLESPNKNVETVQHSDERNRYEIPAS